MVLGEQHLHQVIVTRVRGDVQGCKVLHRGPPVNDVTATGRCSAAVDAAFAVVERPVALGAAAAPQSVFPDNSEKFIPIN